MGDPNAPPLRTEQLLRLLASHGVAYIIVGGLAAVVHGAGRVTFDIDVVPEWTPGNLDRLAHALLEANARLRVPGSIEPVGVSVDARTLRNYEVSTWRTDHGDIDVIRGTPTKARTRLAGYRTLKRRAGSRTVHGLAILVADLDDVIESKEALAREPDLVALPELYRLRDRITRGRDR